MDFLRYATTRLSVETINYPHNYCIPAFVVNLGHAAYGFAPPPPVAQAWLAAGKAAGLGVIALGYAICLGKAGDAEAEFSLLCIAMLAGSLRTWGHYFVFLIFPAVAAVTRVAARPSVNRVMWLAMILVLLNVMGTWSDPFLDRHIQVKIVVNCLPLYGLVALGVFWANQLLSGTASVAQRVGEGRNTNEHERSQYV
jgi:hypothetical protein